MNERPPAIRQLQARFDGRPRDGLFVDLYLLIYSLVHFALQAVLPCACAHSGQCNTLPRKLTDCHGHSYDCTCGRERARLLPRQTH